MRQALDGDEAGQHPSPVCLCFPLPAVRPLTGDRTIPLPAAVAFELPPAIKTGGDVLRIRFSIVVMVVPPSLAAIVTAKGLLARIGAVGQGLAAVAALAGVVILHHIPAPLRISASSSSGSTNAKISLLVNPVLCWIYPCKLSLRLESGTIHTTMGNTPKSLCSTPER